MRPQRNIRTHKLRNKLKKTVYKQKNVRSTAKHNVKVFGLPGISVGERGNFPL